MIAHIEKTVQLRVMSMNSLADGRKFQEMVAAIEKNATTWKMQRG
jgi:hypothetical protein